MVVCDPERIVTNFSLQQVGTANENIAKLVFVELNNAWSDFENDSGQQNLFAT